MSRVFVDMVLSAPTDEEFKETLSFHLHGLGFSGFLEDDRGMHCYISKQSWSDILHRNVLELLHEHASRRIVISAIEEIEDKNWNQQWEESIQPIDITPTIVITPSWHPLPGDVKKTVLLIDPKMSFGTGYHETTRLMIRLIEKYIAPGSIVLDVGTGTGVLAIAAVKLGAAHAVGVDTDEWCSMNGKENVELNKLVDLVEIRLGSLEVVPEAGFDAIFANITRGTIIDLLPSMTEKLGQQGIFIFSGFMADDREIIAKALERSMCGILTILQENEWLGVAARKS